MPKAAEPVPYYVVLDSFTDGSTIWSKGKLVAADDPAIRKWPHNFGPFALAGRQAEPVIEQATAAPGEKRDI